METVSDALHLSTLFKVLQITVLCFISLAYLIGNICVCLAVIRVSVTGRGRNSRNRRHTSTTNINMADYKTNLVRLFFPIIHCVKTNLFKGGRGGSPRLFPEPALLPLLFFFRQPRAE